ncbi:MAG: amidohydrolase family protein [Phycisphaerales bacterium]|nr:amidohydrolase family protein [Phycisphaerales bacterium]
MKPSAILYRARAIVDAAGLSAAPAALLLRGGCVLAAGRPEVAEQHPEAGRARVVDLADSLLMPGLVNAHTHLDLTHVGPQPYDAKGGFIGWAERIQQARAHDPVDVRQSVLAGIDLSLRGGTCLIGDIAGAGSLVPLTTLRRSPLHGVSYVEFFGQGDMQNAAIATLSRIAGEISHDMAGVRLGVQPHAPYSAGLRLYDAAASSGLSVATHLAESPEEARYVAHGDGPIRQLVERLGVWNPAILQGDDAIGQGRHPIDHLRSVLRIAPLLVAHINDLGNESQAGDHLALLARSRCTVAYCPRASDYFHHADHFGPHPYRTMLDAGINVALGTDSIVTLPTDHADRLSILDEMRYLRARDGTDPMTLLTMATVNGAIGLRFDPAFVTFSPGPIAGVAAVALDGDAARDPLTAALDGDAPITLLPLAPHSASS